MRGSEAGDLTQPARAVISLSREARDRLAFVGIAGALIVAGGLVAAANGATRFDHGSWLAAYLVLVGGVAQLLLGMGCLALPEPVTSPRLRHAQLALWNAGTGIVAGGVLAGMLSIVVAGSAVVVAALGCFALGGGPSTPAARNRVLLYRAVIAALIVSVIVGGALAASGHGSY